MTASKRTAPDPSRPDLRSVRIWRRRNRLLAALAELEGARHPGVRSIHESAYWLEILTGREGEIPESELDLQEAANSWLEQELAHIDPEVLARHLKLNPGAVSNQQWRRELIGELDRLAREPGFPPNGLSGPLARAATDGRYVRFGDRKLVLLGWKLVRLMHLSADDSSHILGLLQNGAVGG